ncbi:hypothetical protein SORBI_3001G256500 [Sorghum bicolor]|uniref:Uncharacterized protein n=1 Tax=Sorghum bicolor TaxID=4558 RepID=A0A1B6QKZ7_SORBI|nr:hypothetical protein SORBI_3001G256500 [Sorghum bicolor]
MDKSQSKGLSAAPVGPRVDLGTLLVFIDIYGFFYDMMMHPQRYRIIQSTRGCCGTGLLEAGLRPPPSARTLATTSSRTATTLRRRCTRSWPTSSSTTTSSLSSSSSSSASFI